MSTLPIFLCRTHIRVLVGGHGSHLEMFLVDFREMTLDESIPAHFDRGPNSAPDADTDTNTIYRSYNTDTDRDASSFIQVFKSHIHVQDHAESAHPQLHAKRHHWSPVIRQITSSGSVGKSSSTRCGGILPYSRRERLPCLVHTPRWQASTGSRSTVNRFRPRFGPASASTPLGTVLLVQDHKDCE